MRRPRPPTDGLANRAAVFCEAQDGSVGLRTDEGGGQQGVFMFDDGSECDESAFYRGDCAPATDTSEEQSQATVAVRGRAVHE